MHSSYDPDVKDLLGEPASILKEEMFKKEMMGEPPKALTDDERKVCEYLCKALDGGETLRNFCYLLLTDDPQCNEEAVRKIKEGFRGLV